MSTLRTKGKTRGREEHQTRTSLAPGCYRAGSPCHQGIQRSFHAIRGTAARRSHRARRACREGEGRQVGGWRNLARLQLHSGRGVLKLVYAGAPVIACHPDPGLVEGERPAVLQPTTLTTTLIA